MQFAGRAALIAIGGLVRCRSCISGTVFVRLFLKINIGHSGRHHLVEARRSSFARGAERIDSRQGKAGKGGVGKRMVCEKVFLGVVSKAGQGEQTRHKHRQKPDPWFSSGWGICLAEL